MSETPETRKLEHDVVVIKCPLEIPLSTRMRNMNRGTVATRTDRSDFLRVGNSGIPSAPKCTSLTRGATDGPGWDEKRDGVHSDRDTAT